MTAVKTNTELEAVRALEFAARGAREALRDPYHWKWVIIALHNALQNMMVLALTCGNGLRALRTDVAVSWILAYRKGAKGPVEKLDFFLNLFGKIQGSGILCFTDSRAFQPSRSQQLSVERLNSLRNRFLHFLLGTWLIEAAGLPRLCLDCLDAGEFLSWESGNIWWHSASPQRVRRAFRRVRQALEASSRAAA